ncbi:hypothetical protein JOM56_008315 [Amanita muscaria]
MDHDEVKAGLSTLPIAAAPKPKCVECKVKEAIYACPRCSLRSCSAKCSASHKKAQNCSGERNKAAYVSMNKYTWGTMMNDYVFLEDMGRKVGDWGNEIVRGGYGAAGKGRENAPGKRKWTRTKKDILKLRLGARDIEMELLPQGMQRKKINQSYWDFKKKTALLTIEFRLITPGEPPFTLVTHRNDMNTQLLKLIQGHISRAKKNNVPPWVQTLVIPDVDDPESFTPPHFVMPAPRAVVPTMELCSYQDKILYYRFDPTELLSTLLKGTQFVEFPTVEVWQEFNGIVIDRAGVVSRVGEGRSGAKRRKLSKEALTGLVGAYGSDDSEDAEKVRNVSSTLVEYDESTGEGMSTDEGSQGEDEDADEKIDVDPATLLRLVQEARQSGHWKQDEDEIDWGELSEGEPS